MFGYSKQPPITLALRGVRLTMMTEQRHVKSIQAVYLDMRARLVGRSG